MDTKTVKLLAEYNQRTNEKMNRFIEGMSPAQWDQNFGGYYPSIHALCNHVYIADLNWLKRFGNLREFVYLKDEVFHRQLNPGSSAFESQQEYLVQRSDLDLRFMALVSELSGEDLEKTLTFKSYNGLDQQRNFGGAVLHVFNHQTHHRGMISVYLDSMGIENDYSNLIVLV